MKTWRDIARPIIAEVIGCFSPRDDPKYIKKAVMATYPWGPRKYWPYKIWCDEVRRQMRGLPFPARSSPAKKPVESDPRQGVLFEPLRVMTMRGSETPAAGSKQL